MENNTATEEKRQKWRDYKRKANKEKGEYYLKAKERTKEWAKRSRKEDPLRWMLIRAKNRAKKRGLEFNILKEDLSIPEKCPILLIPIIVGGDLKANSPSLDRIDTNKGYIVGNVRVISNKANACKSDLSAEQIERLYRYSQGLL